MNENLKKLRRKVNQPSLYKRLEREFDYPVPLWAVCLLCVAAGWLSTVIVSI
jgi:hypothetical protein